VKPLPVALRNRAAAIDRTALRRLIAHCLQAEGAPEAAGLGVVLAGDRLLRTLNRDWRGIDRTTDVLSFPYGPPPEAAGGSAADGPAGADPDAALLGEVVISVPRCVAQARERDEDPGVELVRLVVHGVLHCLGYDHERPADRARMRPREQALRRWAARQGIGAGLLRPRSVPRGRRRP